jgi:hypothetical protein
VKTDLITQVAELDFDTGSDVLAKIMQVIAQKTQKARERSKGYAPYELNKWISAANGSYACVEVLVTDGDNFYILRRTDPNEPEWVGKDHIPGRSFLTTDWELILVNLFLKEFTDDPELAQMWSKQVTPVGLTLQEEPEREGVIAFTPIFLLKLDSGSINSLKGEWTTVDINNLDTVIHQHREVLRWAIERKFKPPVLAVR